ncbi:MaoC/PaaZ C-terminal domain-containing protein [Massilia sp. Se16.2.3]|uniref:MaoC/PaaZ C-terminal domain-containing protein n=1 Tax=Massilia sp. Se16.2.3 TaxID=2709303 RepID=UPI001E391E7A|nr:MaoC/PaaZ C-terminal domain-containing protein [Massilia sp. Se16.2.3]
MGRWQLAASAGRDYARVSGDWNPIHLAGWSARLMGLRAPIIHGMHTLGRACALLQARAGRPVTALSVRFRAPVALGSAVVLAEGAAPGEFMVLADGALAAEGHAAFAGNPGACR